MTITSDSSEFHSTFPRNPRLYRSAQSPPAPWSDELPKTGSGKVSRGALREAAEK